MNRDRFPVDPWRLVECEYSAADAGTTETLFSLGNGYLGMRGNHPDEARSHEHGTFVNGFHETWPIKHAETAYGFAEVGQSIVSVPDPKPMQLEVGGERFSLDTSRFTDYRRELDMRDGVLRRELIWETASGPRLRVEMERIVSFTERHLAAQRLTVTLLPDDAAHSTEQTGTEHIDTEQANTKHIDLAVESRIVNRQDQGVPEMPATPDAPETPALVDPRRLERPREPVLIAEPQMFREKRVSLAYRTARSKLGIALAAEHLTNDDPEISHLVEEDGTTTLLDFRMHAGESVEITKLVTYYDGQGDELEALGRNCEATLDAVVDGGFDAILTQQRKWVAQFWQRSNVQIEDQPETQQAVRWCLFQLAQASARAGGRGIAAKGVSGSGYSGHYFWDSEIYVLPFLSYTTPEWARNALEMRVQQLPAARRRARQLDEAGALFPWRTIIGEEASAYYPAGTAQYHIDADICYAVAQYLRATGDDEFLANGGIDIAVETARMWASLGFWRRENGRESFHLHGVTGPDEYTAVVNDNLYTNSMARFNLGFAAMALVDLAMADPEAHRKAVERLNIDDSEPEQWSEAAARMHLPFNAERGIHPQHQSFLDSEIWDFENTPPSKYPLLLHFHPLVIYRHQVLKQADVVLALFLQSNQFTMEQKRANFEYYDPLTTGDSTLSSAAQSIIAAEVGYAELALEYFEKSISVDLENRHRNAEDGVHVASAGGVWSALVFGFSGMRDVAGELSFDPRLPADWPELRFPLTFAGRTIAVTVRQDSLEVVVTEGDALSFRVRGEDFVASIGSPAVAALADQGPILTGRPRLSDH